MNTAPFFRSLASTPAGSLAPLPTPDGSPFPFAPNGNARRHAVQTYLYHTQFYPGGRTDGLPDDVRMDAAIRLVQIAARLPETGVFNDEVRAAIERYRATASFRDDPPNVPVGTPGGVTATPSAPRSFARDLATFAILTSPAWGLLLFIQRPWTKLRLSQSRTRTRSR